MRIVNFALLVVAALSSACATATRGETEQVVFLSEPPGAKMETTTGLTCTTPCTIEIPRRDTFTAKFSLDGEVEEVFVDTEVPDEVAGTTAANILLTPIILIPVAVAVDAASGANLNHTPNPVQVRFETLLARKEDVEGATGEVESAEATPAGETDRTFKLDNSPGATAPSAKAAATVPTAEPEPTNAIWVNVTVDMTSGLHYHCTHFSGTGNKLDLDRPDQWQPVSIRHDPGVDLAARILQSGAEPVIEFWQRADGRPESEAFRVPLPSLEPGAKAQMLTKLRSVDPYDVCGHFTIFVDVVERPGAA